MEIPGGLKCVWEQVGEAVIAKTVNRTDFTWDVIELYLDLGRVHWLFLLDSNFKDDAPLGAVVVHQEGGPAVNPDTGTVRMTRVLAAAAHDLRRDQAQVVPPAPTPDRRDFAA